MEVSDRTRINMLFDFYGVLLTEKQNELFELHFQYDLSLGEIGENFQISRQAVHDLLRRTIAQLNSYEERLQLVNKYYERQQILHELDTVLDAGDCSKAKALTEKLKNV